MAKWPLSPPKVWDTWKEVTASATPPAALVFAGDPTLAARAGEEFAPAAGQPRSWTRSLDDVSRIALGEGDILVVFASPQDEDRAVDALKRAKAKAAVVAVDEGPASTTSVTWYRPGLYRVSFVDAPAAWQALIGAILDVSDESVIPLARRYPALRQMASRRLIRQTARQNAAIGAAFFIPGTDMPVMTANQIKMVLSMAVMWGEELTKDRAFEIVSVVGAGLGLRMVSRQLLVFVPGPGWALKGAVGYSGTVALGEAALRYFQDGAPGTPARLVAVADRLRDLAGSVEGQERVKGAVRRLRGRVDTGAAGERLGSLTRRFRQ
jgi:uncharacterized protein (DUF697 family)